MNAKRTRKNHFETKSGNYLLRSTRQDALLDTLALVHAGRVKVGGHGFRIVVKADGTWAGNCEWTIDMLETRCLVSRITYMDGTSVYELTQVGHKMLDGALTALGRRIDTVALLARIDAHEVW